MCHFVFLETLLKKWTAFLNSYFDFGSNGERGITQKEAISLLVIALVIVVPILIFLEVSGPEQLPGT